MKLAELYEAAAGKDIVFEPVSDIEAAIDILNTHCKNALWMLHENKPVWRGFTDVPKNLFQTIDTSKSVRRSENTSNHYTVILDNNPKMAKYPKRSKSLICSMSRGCATSFGDDLGAFAVIPFDDAKIGAVNNDDLWNVNLKLFGIQTNISDFNYIFQKWGIEDDIQSLEAFGERLRSGNAKPSMTFRGLQLELSADVSKNFMGALYDVYAPDNLGFSLHNTSNLKGVRGEVWVGGKVLLIDPAAWKKARYDLQIT